MPPKFRFTREEMIYAAVDIVRESGADALTARALAAKLGCSAKPIFGLFQNMEEVRAAVIEEANRLYQDRLKKAVVEKEYPPYKATGMAYIRFAKEETELFKLLYMRDRSREAPPPTEAEELDGLLSLVQKATGLSREDAFRFHLETWIYVHGIATMIATGYLDWDPAFVSDAVTDCYLGLKYRFCGEEKRNGSD